MIKIDVQGYERDVVVGLDTIRRSREVAIVTEFFRFARCSRLDPLKRSRSTGASSRTGRQRRRKAHPPVRVEALLCKLGASGFRQSVLRHEG